MDEQSSALLVLIISAVILVPVYLLVFLAGYLNRKKLVIRQSPKAAYIFSVPIFLLIICAIVLFGSKKTINNVAVSSIQGRILFLLAWLTLLVGLTSIIVIAVQTIQARDRRKPM